MKLVSWTNVRPPWCGAPILSAVLNSWSSNFVSRINNSKPLSGEENFDLYVGFFYSNSIDLGSAFTNYRIEA